MELKEAIENLEKKGTLYTNLEVILAAARRDLARQEAETPYRAWWRFGDEHEKALLAIAKGCDERNQCVDSMVVTDAAARLRVVREKVVPWLRNLGAANGRCNGGKERAGERCTCCHRLVLQEGGLFPQEMLRALGEDP